MGTIFLIFRLPSMVRVPCHRHRLPMPPTVDGGHVVDTLAILVGIMHSLIFALLSDVVVVDIVACPTKFEWGVR